jgi:hypothetical protein
MVEHCQETSCELDIGIWEGAEGKEGNLVILRQKALIYANLKKQKTQPGPRQRDRDQLF